MESLKSLPIIAASFNLMTGGINPPLSDIWNTFPSWSQIIFQFFHVLKLNPACLTAADVLTSALDGLHTELMLEESRGLFLRYDKVDTPTSMLREGLRAPLDILMWLAEHSCK